MTNPIGNLTQVWVRGAVIDIQKAAAGEVEYGVDKPITFTPNVWQGILVNSGTGQIIISNPVRVTPAATDGTFGVRLYATDDPDVNPTGFTYSVQDSTKRKFDITLPADTPVIEDPADPLVGQRVIELTDIQPAPGPNPGTVQLARGVGIDHMDGVGGWLWAHYDDGRSEAVAELPAAVPGPEGPQGPPGLKGDTGDPGPATTDASLLISGTLSAARLPNHSASLLTTGTLDNARLAALDASLVTTGTFGAGRIPNLPASQITSGTLSASLLPNHSADLLTSGTVSASRLPTTLSQRAAAAIATASNASSITPDASAGSVQNLTGTGSTLAIGVPTNGTDRQVLRLAIVRSTAASMDVTLNASIALSTGLTARTFTVPSGKVLLVALERVDMITSNTWILTAATIQS